MLSTFRINGFEWQRAPDNATTESPMFELVTRVRVRVSFRADQQTRIARDRVRESPTREREI